MPKQADTKPVRTALQQAGASEKDATVHALLERERPELERVLPEAVSVDAFAATVLAELRRVPALYESRPADVLSAMLLAARLGLEPGPLGHVYIVPAGHTVEFVIGYRGFLTLAYRSGHVKDVAAALVQDGEPFSFRKGTRPYLDHEPRIGDKPTEVVAAYAVARLRTGGSVFEVIGPAEWEKARKASPAGSKNEGPWHEERGAMIRKTAVRRLEPMLPTSPLITKAVERDSTYAEQWPPWQDAETAL